VNYDHDHELENSWKCAATVITHTANKPITATKLSRVSHCDLTGCYIMRPAKLLSLKQSGRNKVLTR